VWLGSIGGFAFLIGVIANSISAADISPRVQREIEKLGSGSILTPRGYLGFTFIFFVLVVCLFVVSQVGVARAEEDSGRLETTLALPMGRRRWLGGPPGARAGGSGLDLAGRGCARLGRRRVGGCERVAGAPDQAGANCLPVAILFLGLAALCYAIAPRAGTGIAYGLVCLAFLWQLFGAVLGAPGWLVDLSPFEHVGLVPAQPFRAGAAAVMLGVGLVGALAAIGVFQRRDLVGG
jgi:ABC-2 type transport system permease protein